MGHEFHYTQKRKRKKEKRKVRIERNKRGEIGGEPSSGGAHVLFVPLEPHEPKRAHKGDKEHANGVKDPEGDGEGEKHP